MSFTSGKHSPNDFSALGAIFLVRRSALDRVKLWDFGDAAQPANFRPLPELPSPLLDRPCIPPRYCRHERFPQHFFPDYPEWSRKGYLLTRWQLGRQDVDLLNVHLFHDDSCAAAPPRRVPRHRATRRAPPRRQRRLLSRRS